MDSWPDFSLDLTDSTHKLTTALDNLEKTQQKESERPSNAGPIANASETLSKSNTDKESPPDSIHNVDLLVVGPFGRGGINDYIEEQVQRLDGRISVSVHDSSTAGFGSRRINFIRGLMLGLFAFLRFPFRLQPDIVHIHTSHNYSFYRKSLYTLFTAYVWNVPVILHIHGSSFDKFINTRSQLVASLQRIVFRASDDIIVLSERWKEVVSQRADESKIRVIPNAVDPKTFPADPTDDVPHIAFVSNLIERKGVHELSEAIEELSTRDSVEFRTSIAGDGPLSERIEQLADQHEEVTYLGYVSEERKRLLLRESSVYALPTYAEGLPIAMLEGMAGANAIVSTSVAAIPEVIGPDHGILVEPGEVEELADALEEILTSPERRFQMARNNRRAIEEQYSWDHVIEELIDVYRTHSR